MFQADANSQVTVNPLSTLKVRQKRINTIKQFFKNIGDLNISKKNAENILNRKLKSGKTQFTASNFNSNMNAYRNKNLLAKNNTPVTPHGTLGNPNQVNQSRRSSAASNPGQL